jgi:hypothetical protein
MITTMFLDGRTVEVDLPLGQSLAYVGDDLVLRSGDLQAPVMVHVDRKRNFIDSIAVLEKPVRRSTSRHRAAARIRKTGRTARADARRAIARGLNRDRGENVRQSVRFHVHRKHGWRWPDGFCRLGLRHRELS